MSASSEPARRVRDPWAHRCCRGALPRTRPLRPRDSASTLTWESTGRKRRYLTEEERAGNELLLAGGKVRLSLTSSRGLSRHSEGQGRRHQEGRSRKTKRTKTRSPSWTTRAQAVLEEMQRSGGRVTSARVAGILGCARSTGHARQRGTTSLPPRRRVLRTTCV